ncbi:MAG: hypothetical protein QG628_871 [Patescibacteria group bacterium]|nr:hypothetical protein [Patescibacteria group bacterium]
MKRDPLNPECLIVNLEDVDVICKAIDFSATNIQAQYELVGQAHSNPHTLLYEGTSDTIANSPDEAFPLRITGDGARVVIGSLMQVRESDGDDSPAGRILNGVGINLQLLPHRREY